MLAGEQADADVPDHVDIQDVIDAYLSRGPAVGDRYRRAFHGSIHRMFVSGSAAIVLWIGVGRGRFGLWRIFTA